MFQPDKLRELVGVPTGPKKADPFTLPALISWLRTKPTNESYSWHNSVGGCLVGQYIAAKAVPLGYCTFCDEWEDRNGFRLNTIAAPYEERSFPISTFGAALARAEKLLRSVERP
jgi:hypothetical protein